MNRVLIPVSLSAPPVPLAADARVHRWGGETMGTTWSVVAVLPPSANGGGILQGIQAVLDGVIAQMSNWVPDSDLSRFNRAAPGSWHALPDDCFHVLQTALQVARDSGGAYDPSAGPLVDLWGFGPAPRRDTPPSADQVAQARQQCGWARIELDIGARRAQQPGGVSLDFCAIAKGFAVDAVARYLDAQGLSHHLTEIGGELRGHGVKPDGMPWWVALEAPPGVQRESDEQTLVALHGLSVATSGDYRRFFDSGGRRYAHTIDPRTGYPASHALASVTVLHAQCMMADALSTALTVLGPQAGMEHARRHGIAACFLVRHPDGFDEHLSPAFAAMLA
ncbi:FAD:protein FMN transferase [Cupriavidus sp. IDO]|uniref:FAD:protein FMN transferase n=1 Tax=Cupriavidus sp. IDO TaxID=1539142 RepID=UPI000579138D|nr:FAD:protein FMN transferase [Cupriavidus sp. IDO]KWR74640.1 thiamine biosynthesis protein ApbE [Cupriavidus sp. IDO]